VKSIPFVLFTLAALASISACSRKPSGPTVFESPDHSFRFTVPEGASVPLPQSDLLADPASAQTVDVTSRDEFGSFVVRRMRIPDKVWALESDRQMLDEAQGNLLRLPGASIDREEDLKIDDHAGRSVRLRDGSIPSKPQFSRLDFVLARPNLYILTFAAARAEDLERPEVQKFFGSLVVGGK
jgi:hypothetical protein